jgi:hypothetical protein
MTDKTVGLDETLSFAYRDGDDVEVTLRMPEADIPTTEAHVRLRAGRRSFSAPADVATDQEGVTVTFNAPSATLRRAVWDLAIQPPSGEALHVQGRLLARPGQPVALLPGPVPTTLLPAPKPDVLTARAAHRLPTPLRTALRRGRAAVTRNRA